MGPVYIQRRRWNMAAMKVIPGIKHINLINILSVGVKLYLSPLIFMDFKMFYQLLFRSNKMKTYWNRYLKTVLKENVFRFKNKGSFSDLWLCKMKFYWDDDVHSRITKVMFMNEESSDTLFICCGSSSYSSLEVWQLLEQMLPQHKMFSLNTGPYASIKTHKWMHKATIPHPSQLTSIAGPKLPMSRNVVETSGFLPYIAMSYKDGTLQLIHRYTFQSISTSNVDSLCQPMLSFSPHSGTRMQGVALQLSALSQTGSGCGLFGMHDGRVYLFSTYNGSRDTAMQLSPSGIVLLLEYAMVTGQDWWDIFLSVRQGKNKS